MKHSMNHITRGTVTLLALAAGITGCGAEPLWPDDPLAGVVITAASPVSLTATVGSQVPDPPTVIAQDESGNPVEGALVTFAALTGGGRLGSTSAVTNPAGIATAGEWIMHTAPGESVVEAKIGSSTVRFTARALTGPVVALIKLACDNESIEP